MLCAQADSLDALRALGVEINRILLIGGGAQSPATRQIAASLFAPCPVAVPTPGEYVADGAARQAAWVLAGTDAPPDWPMPVETADAGLTTPEVRAKYAAVREMTWQRPAADD